jgi:uncharacterized protein
MIDSEKKDIAENYIKALTKRDAALLTSITTEDIVWRLPGTSLVSGEARGVEAILKISETLTRFGVSISLERVVYGLDDVGAHQHNTGIHDGKVLDEHNTTVCHLRGRKIHRLETFISDVNMLNEFFVPLA